MICLQVPDFSEKQLSDTKNDQSDLTITVDKNTWVYHNATKLIQKSSNNKNHQKFYRTVVIKNI